MLKTFLRNIWRARTSSYTMRIPPTLENFRQVTRCHWFCPTSSKMGTTFISLKVRVIYTCHQLYTYIFGTSKFTHMLPTPSKTPKFGSNSLMASAFSILDSDMQGNKVTISGSAVARNPGHGDPAHGPLIPVLLIVAPTRYLGHRRKLRSALNPLTYCLLIQKIKKGLFFVGLGGILIDLDIYLLNKRKASLFESHIISYSRHFISGILYHLFILTYNGWYMTEIPVLLRFSSLHVVYSADLRANSVKTEQVLDFRMSS